MQKHFPRKSAAGYSGVDSGTSGALDDVGNLEGVSVMLYPIQILRPNS